MSGDLERALRSLLRHPGLFVAASLTLALGIAANTAIFSVVHAVLISPLPYPEAERLVGVWHTAPGIGADRVGQTHISYRYYARHNSVLEAFGIYIDSSVSLTGGDRPQELPATWITPSVLEVLRVPPALGRRFTDEEESPDAEPTVILGHGLWRRRFGSDPEVLGSGIDVDGVTRTVIGVMPAGFGFPRATTELWLPLQVDPGQPDRSIWGHRGVGRLRPGVEPSAAQIELSRLTARLPEVYPDPAQAASVFAEGRFGSLVRPLKDDVVGEVSGVLRILLGSVGLILLIAAANVGNLFLVRAEARRREVALRTALGASRGRLARLFLTEATLVALAGGLVGLVLAEWALRLFLSLAPPNLPRMDEVAIDAPVLLFACSISLLSSLVFGSMPAWRSLPAPALALRESERSTTGSPGRLRVRYLLVVGQLSLALVLMVGSGLLVRSFLQLRGVGPGCAVDGVLTLRLAPPEARYPGGPETAALYLEILDRVRALPGVLAAGSGSGLPFTGDGIMIGQSFEDFPVAAGEHVRN